MLRFFDITCIIQQRRGFFNTFLISVNKFKKNQKKIAKSYFKCYNKLIIFFYIGDML